MNNVLSIFIVAISDLDFFFDTKNIKSMYGQYENWTDLLIDSACASIKLGSTSNNGSFMLLIEDKTIHSIVTSHLAWL